MLNTSKETNKTRKVEFLVDSRATRNCTLLYYVHTLCAECIMDNFAQFYAVCVVNGSG